MAERLSAPPKPLSVRPTSDEGSLLTPLRERVRDAYGLLTDRHWFGLTPFEIHVVICGFPRSGTTLLHLMLETSMENARTFGRERNGLVVARRVFPGRFPVLITKRPNDIFAIDEIREYYTGRRTRPRFVLSLRDPRSVLTSTFSNRPNYYVSANRWRSIYEHVQYQRRFKDVQIVEYRDLVERPEVVQQQLAAFFEYDIRGRFEQFHSSVPSDFNTQALNGVRPLDRSSLGRWRAPKHRQRIQQLLTELPELPQCLIEMGYEPDIVWTRDYL